MINVIKLAMRNRIPLQNAKNAGCFHCLAVFLPQEVTEYTDQGETALCPKCGTDAVLPETVTPIDGAYLQAAKDSIFSD